MSEIVDRRTGLILDTTTTDGISDALILHHHAVEQIGVDVAHLTRQLTDGLANLAAEIEAVTGTITDAQTAWCWYGLDPAAAKQLWQRLRDWVGWLRATYPLARQIPPCWWRHAELVEELTALFLAWRGAYRAPNAPATAAVDWHDRWLPGLLHRITTQWKIPCTAGQHEDRVPGAHATTAVDDEPAYNAHVDADVAAHRQPDTNTGALAP